MAQRIYADQASEAVSERSFSTAAMYSSKLRKALGADVASKMVKCNKNHKWLWDEIKGKIWQRYIDKFRNTPGAFDDSACNDDDDPD